MEFTYPQCCCVCLSNAERKFDVSATHYQNFSQGSIKTILTTSPLICNKCWRNVARRRVLGLGAGAIGLLFGGGIIFLSFQEVIHPLWFLAGILVGLILAFCLFNLVAKEPAAAFLMKTKVDFQGNQNAVVVPSFRNTEYENQFKAMNQSYLSQLTK